MRSGGDDFNYFKLTKLANFVQFKRMLMFCLEDWGTGPLVPSLGYATATQEIRGTENFNFVPKFSQNGGIRHINFIF